MSASPEIRAETARLARVLGIEDLQALAFVAPAPVGELREYREAVTDLLYDDEQELLTRTADAARLLPARTLATIGEHALGPLICARLTGLLDPRRAAEISEHFTLEFLAQLAAELDPRRAGAVLGAIAPDTVVATCTAMAAAGEHVAMARFVACLDESTLDLCVEALNDQDLLRTAFLIEDQQRLGTVFETIGLQRTERMFAAARENGLLEEAEYVASRLA